MSIEVMVAIAIAYAVVVDAGHGNEKAATLTFAIISARHSASVASLGTGWFTLSFAAYGTDAVVGFGLKRICRSIVSFR
eukprot:CAMPEP_0202506316 /NCGR_PEP_ID=MMETSP1361-20130828/49922_1 /ASSEMBLY_ACC=CAM_ASM_000849 /TAXON_ID=210615 /ORGANISM="Staurosira complex sp., Strain CCMP2646" /LENGTH=78 /DNA_ID=CAMNT_0049140281 /DNA_START=801 /DNA_END=1033 /DNA_ORIENTATION=+